MAVTVEYFFQFDLKTNGVVQQKHHMKYIDAKYKVH